MQDTTKIIYSNGGTNSHMQWDMACEKYSWDKDTDSRDDISS
jgi:hypothetical protein